MAKILILLSAFALLGTLAGASSMSIIEQSSNLLQKKYFLITLEKLTWAKAFQYCRSLDMSMVSIESKEENDRINEQILNEGHADKWFYTSGMKLGQNETLMWMGKNRPFTYTNWASNQPDDDQKSEKCINIFGVSPWDNLEAFTWNDIRCTDKLNFICEQEVQTDDKSSNQTALASGLSSTQKRFYPITLKKLSWSKANQHCRSLDMQLVSIESQEEQDYLFDQILNRGHDESFWTSGMRVGINGTLKWMGSKKSMTYTNWNNGEPNNKYKRCINLLDSTSNLKWNDLNCENELYFICERN